MTAKMLRAAITGVRRAELVEVDRPRPRDNWALVRVEVTPMCTEYKAWKAGWLTGCLGHEAAGTVVEVAQPGKVAVGDRVVVMPMYPCGACPLCVAGDYIHCRNTVDFASFTGSPEGSATYAQYLLKPDWLLPKIPSGMTTEHASLAICSLGPSFGALQRMNTGAFDTLMVTGLGPVGLGAVANGVFRGARVIGVDSNPWRAERARKLGAYAVVDPTDPEAAAAVQELTHGVGVDMALDCSGVPAAHRFCVDMVRRRGQVAFVGECGEDTVLHISDDMIRKGISLHGVWHYNLSLFPAIMHLVAARPDLVDLLVSHILPMSQLQHAFEISTAQESAKILLHPWE